MSNMITIIFAEGSRFTTEVEVPNGRGQWAKAMKQVGQLAANDGFNITIPVAAVVIDGTHVAQYNGNEAAEIFGLEV